MSGSDCDSLEIGSFYFLSVNLWPIGSTEEGLFVKNPDRHGEVAIFPFQDIPGDLDLFLTDRAWSQAENSFVPNVIEDEGIVAYRTPPDGIAAGIIFGMGNNTLTGDTGAEWIDINVETPGVETKQYFSLGEDGDQIFLYCIGSNGKDRPIAAFAYGQDFLRPSDVIGDYGTNNSSAPGYFFDLPDVDSDMTSSTPGMLEMRPPSDCNNQIYWFWEYDDRCSDGGNSCILELNELRNAMSNSEYWIGKNPDKSICSSALSNSSVLGLVWIMTLMMMWLLAMF